MARVFFPPTLRAITGEAQSVEVDGETVLEIIQAVDGQFPGFQERLVKDGALRPGLMVVVNGSASSLGTLQRVPPAAEIHFLPALGGG